MSCATCASTIESSLETVDGVGDVSVNFATERATVHHADGVSPTSSSPRLRMLATASVMSYWTTRWKTKTS